jgi:hypothetical protein
LDIRGLDDGGPDRGAGIAVIYLLSLLTVGFDS